MADRKTIEAYWQQAFEQGEACWDCGFCVITKNRHPYGESYCVESVRGCAAQDVGDCPVVQARLIDDH